MPVQMPPKRDRRGSIVETLNLFTSLDESEKQLAAGSKTLMMGAWFFLMVTLCFGYNAMVVLLYYFAGLANQAGRPGWLVVNWVLPVNCFFLVATQIFHMMLDYSKWWKPHSIISFCCFALIINWTMAVVFKSQPIVLLLASALQAIFCGWAQPQLWIISTYFPYGDRMRSMLSLGGGAASLVTVILDSVIRVICFYTIAHQDSAKLQHQSTSFYIFFGIFFFMLASALVGSIFLWRTEAYAHFEKKASLIFSGQSDNEQYAPLLDRLNLDNTQSRAAIAFWPGLLQFGSRGGGPAAGQTDWTTRSHQDRDSEAEEGDVEIPDTPMTPGWVQGGFGRYFDRKMLMDIHLPAWLLFSAVFINNLVFPALAKLFYSPGIQDSLEAGVELSKQGWPFKHLSSHQWFFSPAFVGFFILAQFLGQLVPAIHFEKWSLVEWFPPSVCRWISSFRAVLVFLILVCCTPAMHWIHSSFIFLWLMAALGFTGGLVQTSTFMVAPALARPVKQPDAGSVCLLFNFIGMASGLGLAVPYVDKLIPYHGLTAVILSTVLLVLLPWFSTAFVMLFPRSGFVDRSDSHYSAISTKTM